MPKEYELRFTKYNKINIITKLKELGFKQIHKAIIYEYTVFHHPLKKENTYIRVRKEFDKITFTYKANTNKKFVDEYEIDISNYDVFLKMLYMLGFKKAYSIEKLREKWTEKNCKEIVFDTYPGLPEYMEVECDSLDNLHKIIKKLNLVEEKYFNLYKTLYGIKPQKKKLTDLTFDSAKKIFIKKIKYNKNLFKKILKVQKKYMKSL